MMEQEAGTQGAMLRFDLPCQALGFSRPPATVQLRFLERNAAWTVVMLVPAGKAEAAGAWLQAQTSAIVVTAPGLAPRTLRCDLVRLPPKWAAWLSAAHIVQVDL